jgi:hypothetical protein
MRPATYYYLAQVWALAGTAGSSQTPSPAPRTGAATRAQPRRIHPGRELPAVARRVLAALSGTSPAA